MDSVGLEQATKGISHHFKYELSWYIPCCDQFLRAGLSIMETLFWFTLLEISVNEYANK